MRLSRLVVLLSLAVPAAVAPATAQATAVLAPLSADTAATPAERAVRATIARDGVHVVHFWAPWCNNAIHELQGGLYEVVEAHPEVSFTFVTVANGGEDGAETLRRYGIPETVTRLAQPGSEPAASRTFLGRPVPWTPTTWVFTRNGLLAFAFNYGEITPEQLSAAIASAAASWTHD